MTQQEWVDAFVSANRGPSPKKIFQDFGIFNLLVFMGLKESATSEATDLIHSISETRKDFIMYLTAALSLWKETETGPLSAAWLKDTILSKGAISREELNRLWGLQEVEGSSGLTQCTQWLVSMLSEGEKECLG